MGILITADQGSSTSSLYDIGWWNGESKIKWWLQKYCFRESGSLHCLRLRTELFRKAQFIVCYLWSWMCKSFFATVTFS